MEQSLLQSLGEIDSIADGVDQFRKEVDKVFKSLHTRVANLRQDVAEVELSTLDALARRMHATAVRKGFWQEDQVDGDKVGSRIALIHSEATELLEAWRKEKGEKEMAYEFADIIIRTLDLYQALVDDDQLAYSLDAAVLEKMEANEAREPMHGHRWG